MDPSPSSSSSSATHNPLPNDEKPTTKCEEINASKLVSVGLPLSTLNPLNSLFFFKPTIPTPTTIICKPILNLQTLVTESFHVFFRNLHSSIDKCLAFLHAFASNNPLFSKLHSISSEYRKFCQINCRKHTNLNSFSNLQFALILPGDSVAGMVVSNGILNFLNIYNTLLVLRLVLTWFPSAPPAIVSPLSTLCDPYLNIFRGIIPPLGGTLDFSPILAFLVLNFFTSTASALPAELPSPEESQKRLSSRSRSPFHKAMSHLTTSQEKWKRRLDAMRSKGSES